MPSPTHDPRQVAEDISNTIESQDKSIVLGDTGSAPGEASRSEQKKPETDEPRSVAGYQAADILDAPVKPPTPDKIEGREFIENKKVLLVIGGAILLFVIGILVAVAGVIWLGIMLAVLAAVLVALGVFLPLK